MQAWANVAGASRNRRLERSRRTSREQLRPRARTPSSTGVFWKSGASAFNHSLSRWGHAAAMEAKTPGSTCSWYLMMSMSRFLQHTDVRLSMESSDGSSPPFAGFSQFAAPSCWSRGPTARRTSSVKQGTLRPMAEAVELLSAAAKLLAAPATPPNAEDQASVPPLRGLATRCSRFACRPAAAIRTSAESTSMRSRWSPCKRPMAATTVTSTPRPLSTRSWMREHPLARAAMDSDEHSHPKRSTSSSLGQCSLMARSTGLAESRRRPPRKEKARSIFLRLPHRGRARLTSVARSSRRFPRPSSSVHSPRRAGRPERSGHSE
mmetsp:Transcript_90642/g.270487  ORF Transcript_90642/g.270487 Transcript_90642/m.270487 type:complete len:321 (-) Transcript_90642:615-1577(-)